MAFNAQLDDKVQAYLEEKRVPQLIEHLFHELAVEMPSDPLRFLATILARPPKPRVMLIGAPCSGKSTVARALGEKYRVPVISFDELLRTNSAAAVAIQNAAAVSGGRADAACAKLVADAATRAASEAGGWIIDGFPRTRSEAVGLQAARVLPGLVVVLDVDDDTAATRVTGQMDSAAVASRGRAFGLNKSELLACYPEGPRRVTVDASLNVADVLAQVDPRVEQVLA